MQDANRRSKPRRQRAGCHALQRSRRFREACRTLRAECAAARPSAVSRERRASVRLRLAHRLALSTAGRAVSKPVALPPRAHMSERAAFVNNAGRQRVTRFSKTHQNLTRFLYSSYSSPNASRSRRSS